MFRQKTGVSRRTVILAMSAMLVTVVFAAAVTVWLVVETRKEQRTIAQLLSEGSTTVARDVGTLPQELRWQLGFSILVLVVLAATAIALVRVFRALLAAQESLREVRMLAGHILASMDHAVLTTDRDGRITSINSRGHELLNVDFDCVGRPVADICRDGMRLDDISEGVMLSGCRSHDNALTKAHGDKRQHLRADCHLLKDTDNHVLGTVLHVRDVTDRALMEERLRRMERFMGLGTLSAGLHHEIKNPLSALSLHVQLLEEHFEGHIEAAQGGTLFLDEITETSPRSQVDLLRVLEQQEFRRLGGTELIPADVRVVSATNRDIEELVREERFREDLYYRLNVIPLQIPPLRERREDVPLLVDHFVKHFCRRHSRDCKRLSNRAIQVLIRHSWPGNIRQLRNLIERLVVTVDGEVIHDGDLPAEIQTESHWASNTLQAAVEEAEKRAIAAALAVCDNHRERTAKLLDVSVRTLHYKMRHYGLH